MEPTARSRTVPLFPVVCLALVAAFVLAAGGRAATGDTLPSPLAYADALGNIALSTDPAFSPINPVSYTHLVPAQAAERVV